MNLHPANQLQILANNRRTARDLVLTSADLRGIQLSGLRADGLDLEEADLRDSSSTGVKWKGCMLREARLDSADFVGAVPRLRDLDQTRLTKAIFVRTRLENCTARGAGFDGADLTRSVLTESDLSRSSLRGANFEGVSASGAGFCGTNLRGALLLNAEFVDANLRGADLTDADLQRADLRGADFRGALSNFPEMQQTRQPVGRTVSGNEEPLGDDGSCRARGTAHRRAKRCHRFGHCRAHNRGGCPVSSASPLDRFLLWGALMAESFGKDAESHMIIANSLRRVYHGRGAT